MNTFKNLCCLLVVGWLVLQVVGYFQRPKPSIVGPYYGQERIAQIIQGDPHGGPDIILWPLPEEN